MEEILWLKPSKKFILQMLLSYREVFYSTRVKIIGSKKQVSKEDLDKELKEFVKVIFQTDYKKKRQLVPAVNKAVKNSKNKQIGVDFGAHILRHQGIDFGEPIPMDEDDE